MGTLAAKHDANNKYEIGVDECSRGTLFGRTYVAAVVLDDNFDHSKMCDSKKIHSQKKFLELATYIKQNAVAWSIEFIEPWEIDQINIRQAVLKGMREAIRQVLDKLVEIREDAPQHTLIMVDGNDFSNYVYGLMTIPYITVVKGDNTYSAIAAASILAKQAHDQYILELCAAQFPSLSTRYGLDSNMGYGTKKHLDGIREFGITKWHRKTFGICRDAVVNHTEEDAMENADRDT